MSAQALSLLIKRTTRPGHEESVQSYWQQFTVTVQESHYVLDALEAAWRQDPSLAFRHSCHHASCGSCGMLVQGREALACITPALEAARGGVLRLEPLRNFPVIADLVVSTSALARKMDMVKAPFVTGPEGATRFVSCIECGLCISACPISAINREYLGPAVLAAARHNIEFPQVHVLANSRDGVWRCRGVSECTDVCPAGVHPAFQIALLRRDLLVSAFTLRKKGKSNDDPDS
jgi:succinate dehydrogenase / fumarate reductase iron-sulfur subunit